MDRKFTFCLMEVCCVSQLITTEKRIVFLLLSNITHTNQP